MATHVPHVDCLSSVFHRGCLDFNWNSIILCVRVSALVKLQLVLSQHKIIIFSVYISHCALWLWLLLMSHCYFSSGDGMILSHCQYLAMTFTSIKQKLTVICSDVTLKFCKEIAHDTVTLCILNLNWHQSESATVICTDATLLFFIRRLCTMLSYCQYSNMSFIDINQVTDPEDDGKEHI